MAPLVSEGMPNTVTSAAERLIRNCDRLAAARVWPSGSES